MIINNISIPHNSCRETQVLKANDVPVLTIGRGSYIVNASVQCGLPTNLHIGQFCSIATNVTFMLQMDKDYKRVSTSSDKLIALMPNEVLNDAHPIKGQIIVQNDVWIGHNATIMSGVKIGNGAIISANAHVVKDVPPYAIVGGNPAKVIKYRFTEEQIADLQAIAWWDWSDEELTNRKMDFALPIQEFIDKYKVSKNTDVRKEEKLEEMKRMLFFPDFDAPHPFWKRVVREYSELCHEGKIPGQLVMYIPENGFTDKWIEELEGFLNENYYGDGNIYVQVGQVKEIDELFAISDCLITGRNFGTVRHTCLADRYNLEIISAADLPSIF